uniref:Two-component sensor protein histidine protein kinase, putative n=1 Tax=Tanacetum cinerariifolium TaxID=118510 RepID=A0A699GED2_TANCI|nr:two-component sensor protein histidine protein kinase, putative [Tanacetum cinerariifolium]
MTRAEIVAVILPDCYNCRILPSLPSHEVSLDERYDRPERPARRAPAAADADGPEKRRFHGAHAVGPHGRGRQDRGHPQRHHRDQGKNGPRGHGSEPRGGPRGPALAARANADHDGRLVHHHQRGQYPDRRPGAPHQRNGARDRRRGQGRPVADHGAGSGRRAAAGPVPERGHHRQHHGGAAAVVFFRSDARGARGRHRGQARWPGAGEGRGGHVEGFDRFRQLDGRQPDVAGAQHRRGDDGRGQRRPVEKDHGGRARRNPAIEGHHQRDGGPAALLRVGSDARGARGRHRGQARRPGLRSRRGRHLEGFDGQRQLHGIQPHRPGAQYRGRDDSRGQRRPVEKDHGGRQGRDPGTEGHLQRDGRSIALVRIGSDARGARGGHRGQAGWPGVRARRGRHLEGFDRQRQLHGVQPDRPGEEYRGRDHGGGARRPVEKDHGGRQGRDPGTEGHHQRDGGPAVVVRVGSDARGARGGHRRQARWPGQRVRRGRYLEGLDGKRQPAGSQPHQPGAGDCGSGHRRDARRPVTVDPGGGARRGVVPEGQHQRDDPQPQGHHAQERAAGLAQDQPGALHPAAAGPARPAGRHAPDPVRTGAAGVGPPRRVLHDGRAVRGRAPAHDRQLRLPVQPQAAHVVPARRRPGGPVRARKNPHLAHRRAARLHRGVVGPGRGAAHQHRGAADPVRAAGEGGHRDRLARPVYGNPPVVPGPADGIDRRGAQHHRGEQPHRVAAHAVAVAGAGTAADQPGAGGKGAPAVRAEHRGGTQEPRGGAGQTGAGRKSHAAGAVVQQLGDNPDGNLSGKQVEFAKTIHGSGSDLLTLINDILDLSKIESGTVTLDVSEYRFQNLRHYVERTFRHMAEAKHLGFSVELRDNLPTAVMTDTTRLQQRLLQRPPHPGPCRRGAGVCRHRHRRGHRGRQAAADLRGIPAGRRLHRPQVRRHRPGTVDLARAGAFAGRRNPRGIGGGAGARCRSGTGPAGAGPRRRGSAVQRRPRAAHAGRSVGADHRGRRTLRGHRAGIRAREQLQGHRHRARRFGTEPGARLPAVGHPARPGSARHRRLHRARTPQARSGHAPHPRARDLQPARARTGAAPGRHLLPEQAGGPRRTAGGIRAHPEVFNGRQTQFAGGGRRRHPARRHRGADRRHRPAHRGRGHRPGGARRTARPAVRLHGARSRPARHQRLRAAGPDRQGRHAARPAGGDQYRQRTGSQEHGPAQAPCQEHRDQGCPLARAAAGRDGAVPAPFAGQPARGAAPHARGNPRSRKHAGRPQGADRGRRPAQHLRAVVAARAPADAGVVCRKWPRRHRGAGTRSHHRDRPDGHHDARDGRLRHHARDPAPAQIPLAAHHHPHRQGDEGRPRQVHRGRRVRLHHQAGGRGAAALAHAGVAALTATAKSRQVALEARDVVAAVHHRPSQHVGPDGGHAGARQGIGADQVDGVRRQLDRGPVAAQQLQRRHFRDIARIDHGHALAADRHRVQAVAHDDVLDHVFIVDEVGRTQDGGAKAHRPDHAFGAQFDGKVRHVDEAVGVDHGQVHQPVDARFPGQVEGDEGLGEFVARHRVEQEQRAHAGQRGAHGVDVEQVAAHDVHAGRKTGFRRIAHKHAHVGAALHELVDDLAAHAAGSAGNEYGHDDFLEVVERELHVRGRARRRPAQGHAVAPRGGAGEQPGRAPARAGGEHAQADRGRTRAVRTHLDPAGRSGRSGSGHRLGRRAAAGPAAHQRPPALRAGGDGQAGRPLRRQVPGRAARGDDRGPPGGHGGRRLRPGHPRQSRPRRQPGGTHHRARPAGRRGAPGPATASRGGAHHDGGNAGAAPGVALHGARRRAARRGRGAPAAVAGKP